jgi:hypothetical protein
MNPKGRVVLHPMFCQEMVLCPNPEVSAGSAGLAEKVCPPQQESPPSGSQGPLLIHILPYTLTLEPNPQKRAGFTIQKSAFTVGRICPHRLCLWRRGASGDQVWGRLWVFFHPIIWELVCCRLSSRWGRYAKVFRTKEVRPCKKAADWELRREILRDPGFWSPAGFISVSKVRG